MWSSLSTCSYPGQSGDGNIGRPTAVNKLTNLTGVDKGESITYPIHLFTRTTTRKPAPEKYMSDSIVPHRKINKENQRGLNKLQVIRKPLTTADIHT